MLFSMTSKILVMAFSMLSVNGDAITDNVDDASSENVVISQVAEENNISETEAPAVAATEAVATKEALQLNVPESSKVVKAHKEYKPGRLAYHRGAAVGMAIGATFIGALISYPLLISELQTGSNGGDMAVLVTGTLLLAGTLGFGPSLGQLCALGKHANLVIPIVRTVAVMLPSLVTVYFMGIGSNRNSLGFGDYYHAFKIAALVSSSLAVIWGIVDIAMTGGIIRRSVRRYEKQHGISNLVGSPMAFENGGGLMMSFRF